jgi:hypothetical protein
LTGRVDQRDFLIHQDRINLFCVLGIVLGAEHIADVKIM